MEQQASSSFSPAKSLIDFVAERHPSNRLRNSLRLAHEERTLPFATVEEYLLADDPRTTMRKCVRNFGLRTANELDRMIRSSGFVQAAESPKGLPSEAFQLEEIMSRLEQQLSQVRARDAIPDVPGTGRMARALQSPFGDRPTWELCSDLSLIKREVMRRASMGVGTVSDLTNGLRICVSRSLQELGADRGTHDQVLQRLFGSEPGPIYHGDLTAETKKVDGIQLVHELLQDLTIKQAFSSEVLPARLNQLVALPQLTDVRLADCLLSNHNWNARLLRFPNVGRTTIQAFWDVCWRRLAAASRDFSEEDRSALASSLGVNADRLVPKDDDLLALAVIATDDSKDLAARVSVPTELGALLDFLLERIKPRGVPIIKRRFGTHGHSAETLEEIGSDLGVTRERIRQLEKGALRELGLNARRVPLRQALDAEAASAWIELAGTSDVLFTSALPDQRSRVRGVVHLALEILHLTFAEWLDEVASRFEHGWLRVGFEPAPVSMAIQELAAAPLPILPCSVDDVSECAERSVVSAALQIGLGKRVHAGYVFSGRLSARPRRTLGVHALLSTSPTAMRAVELLRRYHAAVPTDRCSQRDLTIILENSPHLFLETAEERWVALGRGGIMPSGAAVGHEDDLDLEPQLQVEPDGSVAAALTAELEAAGPQSLGQLTTNPRRWLPSDRSVNSIGPMLIMRPDLFVRVLPGVYCLPHHVPSTEQVVSDELPYLLEEGQARLLALGRRAGEAWGTFPLWTPAAEMRLCQWADRQTDGEILRSLLAVASIEAWPTDQEVIARWQERRRLEARFDLFATLRPQALETRPELERLLAALIDLEDNRATNWMALNRVDGRRIDAHTGCALLATLILLGAVTKPGAGAECSWQLPHHVLPERAAELRALLADQMHRTGALEWSSPLGRSVASEVMSSEIEAPAWLEPRKFKAAFQRDGAVAQERNTQVTLDDVTAAGSRLVAKRRMSEFLDWLASQ